MSIVRIICLPIVFIMLVHSAYGQTTYTTLPLIEDVEPKDLARGEIWAGLPIKRFLAFQNDVITVPVKLAAGEGFRGDVEIFVEPMLKSGQNDVPIETRAAQAPHPWINGYTPNLAMDAESGIAAVSTRLTSGLPVTKYYRALIRKDAQPGTYVFKLEFRKLGKTELIQEKYFTLGVHPGYTFGVPEITHSQGKISVVPFDGQGNSVEVDKVSMLRKDGSGIVLKRSVDGTHIGQYDAGIGDKLDRVLIEKRGFLDLEVKVR